MKNSNKWLIAIIAVVALCCCFTVVILLGGMGLLAFNWEKNPIFNQGVFPTLTASDNQYPGGLPTLPSFESESPQTPGGAYDQPLASGANDTLQTLEDTIVPGADMRDLASRLHGIDNIPETVSAPETAPKTGDQKEFWLNDSDTNKNFSVTANLVYITDHLYFWVEKDINYYEDDLSKLADTFEKNIYPTNREFFGSEWTPGIDNDPHLYILLASGIGDKIAGYFSSADEVNPLAHKYSNAHEMFVLNADNVDLAEEFTYGVLAHEFQHMIHWYRDRNEDSWLNEGFSELAAFLNGFDIGGFDYSFIEDTNVQLNDWPNDSDATTPHYGAGFLFVDYFLNRFGNQATQALVGSQKNGLDSVDDVLGSLDIKNSDTGATMTADDVFADWVLANYIKDGSVGDGRYTYENYKNSPQAGPTSEVNSCPSDWQEESVNQFATDYIRINCDGEYTIQLKGVNNVGVLPESAHSGKMAVWSNKGDDSDMTLTQKFDFSGVSGNLTLNYWTWYDLEKDYDYAYVEASEDGQKWSILNTSSCITDNPSGNSYGCGLTGNTSGWVEESVNISQFAGKNVFLRFEYITDAAVNGEGMQIDDISIPEINYKVDFETDYGGWDNAGFVRIENVLPQTYRVSVIKEGKDTTVEKYEVQPGQNLSIPVQIGGNIQDVVLVVSGTTRFTRQPAYYQYMIGQ